MRVIVSGSRTIDDYGTVASAMKRSPFWEDISLVIHGGARGVDSKAQVVADVKGWKTHVFEPDWDEFGKAAGPIRNDQMAGHADALIAIWDGVSNGTRDMIEKALDHGLDIYVEVAEP